MRMPRPTLRTMTALVRRDVLLVMPPPAAAGDGAPSEPKPPTRTRRFIASTEAVDSYNTVIKADGWDLSRYAKNPVVALFHNTRTGFPVAVGRVTLEGKQLMLDADFAPAEDPVSGSDAEQALRWLDRGVLGVSVGFNPLEYEYNADRETGDEWTDFFNPPIDFTRQELLEISVVMLPANPDALPVGRAAVTRMADHTLPRLAAKLAGEMSRSEFTALVREVTKEEVRALKARRAGNLRGD